MQRFVKFAPPRHSGCG